MKCLKTNIIDSFSYEILRLKHKKSLKDLVYTNQNDSIFSNGIGKLSDSRDEKSNISVHLFEVILAGFEAILYLILKLKSKFSSI